MNISSNSIMTSFIEKPNIRAVHWLKQHLNSELWAKNYIPDEDINKKQKLEMTVKYLDNLLKNNCVSRVDYFNADADVHNIGRQYGHGVQGIPSAFRGLLFGDNTTDIDMVNAHPSILRHLCQSKNIPCPHLNRYCEHRAELIASGEATKQSVVVSMYESAELKTRSAFLRFLDKEIKMIQQELWNDVEFKMIRDSISPQRPNKIGTFMAYVLQSKERMILGNVFNFVTKNGFETCANMFDGLLVYGDFDKCEELNDYILTETGFPIKFITKPHNRSIQVPEDFVYEDEEQLYQSLKSHYENDYCLSFITDTTSYSYRVNEKINFYAKADISQIFRPLKVGNKRFFDLWYDDPLRKTYNSVGIYPHDSVCPTNVLNLWTGFAVEKLKEEIVPIDDVLEHIRILCGHNDEYFKFFLKWMANFFQYPSQTSVMPFLQGTEGCGKGIFMKLFENMIGSDKFLLCEDMEKDLMGNFTGHLQDVMLVNIDEIDYKTASKFVERIKSMITRPEISINEKGQKRFTIPHYIKYITTANPKFPFHISENNRRIAPVSASAELIGNNEYFIRFNSRVEDKRVQYSLYKFLMNFPTVKQIGSSDIPETEILTDAKILSRDSIEDFMEQFIGTVDSKGLFNAYKKFMNESNLQCNMSIKSFQTKSKPFLEKYGVNTKQVDKIVGGKRIRGMYYYTGDFDETIFNSENM
jgi:hypothetical protein